MYAPTLEAGSLSLLLEKNNTTNPTSRSLVTAAADMPAKTWFSNDFIQMQALYALAFVFISKLIFFQRLDK